MNLLTGSTLFIVGSPFQCLCMLEAIHHWHITDYDVIINAMEVNIPMISRLLGEKGINYECNRRNHLFKEVLPLVFTNHKHYDNVFIGNFYNMAYQDMALAYSRSNARVICLDDGTQVLELFSDNPRRVKNKVWVDIVQAFFSAYSLIKRINRNLFFTIYDVRSEKYVIEKNSFNILKSKEKLSKRGVYIIGTNSSKLVLKDKEYKDILLAVISRCRLAYPNQDINYCPHRGDTNNKALKALLEENNVGWFDTKISVEYDFVNDGIYPKEIIGFNSNALFTLHSLFPLASTNNVCIRLKDERDNLEAQIIREKLNGYGISSIMV